MDSKYTLILFLSFSFVQINCMEQDQPDHLERFDIEHDEIGDESDDDSGYELNENLGEELLALENSPFKKLPPELFPYILVFAFFNSKIIEGKNIFEGIESINRYLEETLKNIKLTCKAFLKHSQWYPCEREFLELKTGLLKCYGPKLREHFWEKYYEQRLNSESFDESQIAQPIQNEARENYPILVKILMSDIEKLCRAQLAQMLIFYGANVNLFDEKGNTPLIGAVYCDNETVKMLLDRGANPNIQKRWDKLTPLILAALRGDQEIVENLLAHGANTNLQWYNGETALILASEKGYKEIVEMLLAHDANVDLRVNYDGTSALIRARRNGHKEIVKMLLAKNPKIDDDYEYEMIKNLDEDQFVTLPDEILIYILGFVFLNSKIMKNGPIFFSIFDAIENIKIYIAKTLKDISSTCKSFYIMKPDLIKLKKEILEFYRSKLKFHFLVKSATKEGLYQGDGIEWISYDSSLNKKIAKFLLSDSYKENCIIPHVARRRLNVKYIGQLIDLLLFFGLNINSQDDDGNTALIVGSQDREDIVKFLLSKNANVDIKNNNGDTALIVACRWGHEEAVQMLLEKNADVAILNNDGDNALEIAKIFRQPEIAILLESYIKALFLKFYINMFYKEKEGKESVA